LLTWALVLQAVAPLTPGHQLMWSPRATARRLAEALPLKVVVFQLMPMEMKA
jgi:hypothetical protein